MLMRKPFRFHRRTRHPVVPVPSNFNFQLPGGDKLYYSVKIGPARVLFASSYAQSAPGSAQYNFLQQELVNYKNSRRENGATP